MASDRQVESGQLATFTGRKLPLTEADVVVGFAPHVTSLSDYYPFGSGMEGRTVDGTYRYGFQGQETDAEYFNGAVSFKYRVHDARLGRFLSVDPLKKEYPWYSTYQHAGNTPISATDRDGLEEFIRTRYFDATGNLYRVELQVIGWLDTKSNRDANGLEPIQIIHDTRVDVDPAGNATAQYMGFVYGNRVAAGSAPNVGAGASGSDAFTLQENLAISDSRPNAAGDPRVTDHRGLTEVPGIGVSVYESARIITNTGRQLGFVGSDGLKVGSLAGDFGVVTINRAPAPANEINLPAGYNRTPITAANRWQTPFTRTPASAPAPRALLESRSETDLGKGVYLKVADNDPIGTVVTNVSRRDGSGANGSLRKR